jgi:hypothetical protein
MTFERSKIDGKCRQSEQLNANKKLNGDVTFNV